MYLNNICTFSLAVPSVSISTNSVGYPIFAGTTRFITCFVAPSTVQASDFAWMRNGSPVDTSDSRVTIATTSTNSTLTINPLRTSDGGQYQCIRTVVGNGTAINITGEIDFNVTSEKTHTRTHT